MASMTAGGSSAGGSSSARTFFSVSITKPTTSSPSTRVAAAGELRDVSTTPRSGYSAAAAPRATSVAAAPGVTTRTTMASAESAYAPLLQAIQRLRDVGGIELPAAVAKGVSREFFEDFLSAHEERLGVRLEYRDSCIVVYECPLSVVHESVSSSIISEITVLLGAHLRGFRGGGPSCRIGGSSRQADASLTPITKPNPGIGAAGAADDKGFAYPNVVIEVAVSQTLAGVLGRAAEWIGPNTTVQQAIAVKVGDALGGGARELHAYSFIRGAGANPVQTIDFSIPAHAAAAPGSPAMQLHVPLACLFYQAAGGAPPGIADPLNVDMHFVQQLAASATP